MPYFLSSINFRHLYLRDYINKDELKKVIFLFVCFQLMLSCQKDEITTHKNLTLPGNIPPPYNAIPTVLVENYVSKLNIDLVGLKPEELKKEEDVAFLESEDLSESARETVIGDILDLDAYHDRLFQVISNLLLNGMGYDEVEAVQTEYEFVRDFVYQSGDTFTGQFFDNELNKLQLVLDAPEEYKSGTITLNEYFKRMCYNLIYDEINMGSENFVISCFENFFKRNPTVEELSLGVRMVDGEPIKLLLEEGRNKTEFLDIMVFNNEFYQGRVLDAFRTLLLRDPTSGELLTLTNDFRSADDYRLVQIAIVKTDEYAGFE